MLTKPGDWPDDATHENGNYACKCVHCRRAFVGHKRRVVCKECHDQWESHKAVNRVGEEKPPVTDTRPDNAP